MVKLEDFTEDFKEDFIEDISFTSRGSLLAQAKIDAYSHFTKIKQITNILITFPIYGKASMIVKKILHSNLYQFNLLYIFCKVFSSFRKKTRAKIPAK